MKTWKGIIRTKFYRFPEDTPFFFRFRARHFPNELAAIGPDHPHLKPPPIYDRFKLILERSRFLSNYPAYTS